jgi:hypothetical protein
MHKLAGCTGLEFLTGETANGAATHANSSKPLNSKSIEPEEFSRELLAPPRDSAAVLETFWRRPQFLGEGMKLEISFSLSGS